MTPRASRLLRGTLLGSVATLLAALSHSWAGGAVPGPLALGLGAVFAIAVGTVAVGRRGSLLRTTVAVAIGQLAFHLAFSLLGTGASVVSHAGHHAPVAAIVADPVGAVSRGGAAMWLAHLAAGVLTVLYLRHLERRVWALLRRLGWRVVAVLGIRVPAPAARAARSSSVARVLRTTALHGAIALRGPPLLFSA